MSDKSEFEMSFYPEAGGMVTLWRYVPKKFAWALHVFPNPEHRIWGMHEGWFDGPIKTFGLGPLFSLVWQRQ